MEKALRKNVWCILNQKGGVGKTSLTHNLLCVLAVEHGKKVLGVDVDGQANLSLAFGLDPDEQLGTYEVLTNDRMLTADYIIKTQIQNAYLIPSSNNVFAADLELKQKPGGNFRLADALDQVRNDFDLIFVDVPPSLNTITLNALISSNNVVLIYTASEFSLDGLSQALNTLDEVRHNKRLNVNDTLLAGAVLNMYKIVNRIVNRKIQQELADVTDIPRHFTSISHTTEVEKAQLAHQPICIFNPRHKVVGEYKQLAKEILNLNESSKET